MIVAQVNRLRSKKYYWASFFKNISSLLGIMVAIVIFSHSITTRFPTPLSFYGNSPKLFIGEGSQ